MHNAVAHELGVLQAGDHREHPLLLAPFQVGLEAHQVVQRAAGVLGPQLDVGPGAVAGAGVPQAHRAQGAVADGVRAAGGHHLDGHAALVDGQRRVKVVPRRALGGDERRVKRLVLLFIKGAVEVVGLAAAVAGGGKDLVHVQAVGGDDGRHRVVKAQPVAADQGGHGLAQRAVGQRAGGHQHRPALVDGGDLLPVDGDVWLGLHQRGDGGRELVPVHGQRAAGGHAGTLGGVQQAGAQGAHFQLEQAGGRVGALGFQRVGTDQLGKAGAFVGGGKPGGLLLVQVDGDAAACQPERGFAAGQPGADDGNLHGGSFRMGLVGLGRRGGASAGPGGPYFFSTGLLKPQPSLAQYRVPRFLNSVAPQLGQVSGTGSSQVINLQVGKLPQP